VKVFFDTNILLDIILHREPFYRSAATLHTEVVKKRLRGAVSAVGFDNIHYVSRKKIGKVRALQHLNAILEDFEVVSVDRDLLARAIKSDFTDFEDAIQYLCARRCRASYLISRNQKDFPEGRPRVVSAEEFLSMKPRS